MLIQVSDYQMVPVQTLVLAGNFLLLLLYLGRTTNEYSTWISPSAAGSGVIRVPFCVVCDLFHVYQGC